MKYHRAGPAHDLRRLAATGGFERHQGDFAPLPPDAADQPLGTVFGQMKLTQAADLRHADAGYDEAGVVAEEQKVKTPR